jgi:endonuclease/exonuclease/phosphatase family metal-dependent hydrolase
MKTMFRIGTWNILGRRDHHLCASARDGSIQAILDTEPVDVLSLQEVHFYDGEADPQLIKELQAAGLKHFIGRPFSPSHLDTKAQLGVGIAARSPLFGVYEHRLENPGLKAVVRGTDWSLHDKGLIGAEIQLHDNQTLRVYSLHLFPFFEFGVPDDDNYVEQMWRELWDYADVAAGDNKVILAGDYNQVDRAMAAKVWSRTQWRFCAPNIPTTTTGMSLDDIAVNWLGETTPPKVVATFSDHHLIVANIEV